MFLCCIIIKHFKHTELYSIEFLRTEMTSDPSNYHREYSPYGSYSLFQFVGSDVISVLKNSTEYIFVFCKCSVTSILADLIGGLFFKIFLGSMPQTSLEGLLYSNFFLGSNLTLTNSNKLPTMDQKVKIFKNWVHNVIMQLCY